MMNFINTFALWIIGFLIVVILGLNGWIYFLKSDLSKANANLDKSRAENVLNDLQKEALRSAILDQNNAVEKQRINAVQRAEVYRVKSETIQAKYERERIRVRDLNGSQECDEIRKMIEGAV